jgi:Na+/H+-dicarboxylate symporter
VKGCCESPWKKRKELKMKKKVSFGLAAALAVMVCLGVSLFFQTDAQAQQKKVTAVEEAKFDISVPIADNLKTYVGKDVFVHLRSGKTIQGYVKSIGNGLLHLEKLAGRDFYDALIRIEDISAIEAKFRDMK